MASPIIANVSSPAFGLVVISAAAIGLQVVVTGFRVGATRATVFGSEFLDAQKTNPRFTEMLDEHKKVTGESKFPTGFYPDMGTGRYSALLPYKQWLHFANMQRAHYNYVEGVASAITFNILGGLFFPRFSAAAAACYILGREIFTFGYGSHGANQRIYGAVILDIALVAMMGAAFLGGMRQANVFALLK